MKKTTRVLLFLLIALFVLNTSFAGVVSYAAPSGTAVTSFADLQTAIDSGVSEIYLDDDISYDEDSLAAHYIIIAAAADGTKKNVTIDLNGHKIIFDSSVKGTRRGNIEVSNSSLKICDNSVTESTDYEHTGQIKYGFDSIAGFGGGIHVVDGGSLTLNSGIITGCLAACGGAVSVSRGSSFTMNGGSIDSNLLENKDGVGCGVYVSDSTFTMNGGYIRGNKENVAHQNNGGGVAVVNKATFTMNGGQIGEGSQSTAIGANSISGNGSGVYVNDATFNFAGGTIMNNVASNNGGGIYLDTGSNFTMSNGEMFYNRSTGAGSAIYVNNPETCTISGGKIHKNESASRLGTIYISENCTNPVKISAVKIGDVEITENTSSGIYNKSTKDVTLKNVTITKNTCSNLTYGAGVHDAGDNLKLDGKNYIYDNTDDALTTQSNIYLEDGKLLEIPSDLPDGTKIGVWSDAAKPVKVTKDYGNKANANWQIQPEKYFVSDRDDFFAQKTPNNPTDHEVYLMQPKHTHSISNVSAEGDCITNGIKDHIECTDCGRFFEDTTGALEIEVYDVTADKNSSKHVGEAKYAKETIDVEPTCTKAGSKTLHYNCDKCNGEMKTEKVEIPALGHKFGPWTITKNPTKDADGVEERTCKVCGEKETRPVKYNGKDATEKANNVPTGDNSPVIPLALVMIFSLLNSICIMIIKKNTNN